MSMQELYDTVIKNGMGDLREHSDDLLNEATITNDDADFLTSDGGRQQIRDSNDDRMFLDESSKSEQKQDINE